MRTYWVLFAAMLIFSSCREQKGDPSELVATDKAFSTMSVEKGLSAAFIFYADDSVVKVRDGNFPIMGKNEMVKAYRARPDSGMTLKWHPLKAEVGRSNDLGYTFGVWELYMKGKDTTMYGNYISIWKKQSDGSWKYVLDAGSNTPKPVH